MKLRLIASLIHFGLSALVAMVFSGVVFGLWYPNQLDIATGVTSIFLLVLGVDVVLGPLLTLIVFNPLKKELKRDLFIIVMIQLAALFYGVRSVYQGRPIYVAFNIDRFDLVQASDITPKSFADAKLEQFKSVPRWGAELVFARRPDDPDERRELLFGALSGGADLAYIPKYYDSYSNNAAFVSAKIRELNELIGFNPDSKAQVERLIEKYPPAEFGYLPLRASRQDMTLILNKKTAAIVEYVSLKPWDY
ncbi:TfpX/TfpZ family type IV pilin accessory protein [Cellvibrio sp. UBA7671]|uniref:TfpX/TfpZ family type IV pilin accessory protein n=1 Tax=Cellvibrio sp. UBA7671 TaxID=1946312 RepID=UPI002F35160B